MYDDLVKQFEEFQWVRKAEFVRAVDGDTIEVMFDQGLKDYTKEHLRIQGIDTEELNDRDLDDRIRAQAAKARVEELLTGQSLWVVTFKDRRSFTRYKADVYYKDAEGWKSLAETLVVEGHQKGPDLA
jgi:endonuclease YncB( thermonuclease family)